MKVSTIRIVGKHITENDDELEEGYVEIELEVKDLLDEIDNEDIGDYARWTLDMIPEDDIENKSIEDFDEDELIEALEDSGYNFSKQIGEEDCIEFLEDSGYIVSTPKEEPDLDYIDSCRLEEIQEKFINGSWSEREELYKLVLDGK